MIDLIMTSPAEGPATLFTRNFRIHSGIPIGLYNEGPRAPVALLYGDVSPGQLESLGQHYRAIIGIPWLEDDEIPREPLYYETFTMLAPILARVQRFEREGMGSCVKTSDGTPLVYEGRIGETVIFLFGADLIKATIRILSGELEQKTGTDLYGRHNPPPENVIRTPAVSLHFNLIERMVKLAYQRIGQPLLSIPRWPKSAPLALFLSHDVDVVKKWTGKRVTYEVLKSMAELARFRPVRMKRTLDSLRESMRNSDPYWNFDDLTFLENDNGFVSSWYFAPFGGEYDKREKEFDPLYHRKPAEITAKIRRLKENGCEIGLHGTRRGHLDGKSLIRQIESYEVRMGFKLSGVRQHYLMFRHGSTLEATAEAGLLYDASLGFSDRPGFRNGMASPFFLYPRTHPAGHVVEIPLHFMDGVFLHDADREGMKRKVIEAYLYARTAGGLFSVLVHPGNLDPSEIPDMNTFYRMFLPRCKRDNALSMTGNQIAEWWFAREEVLRAVEYMPELWRIKNVPIPPDMDFCLTAPNIKNMKFFIDGGAGGTSSLNGNTLTLRTGQMDPARGFSVIRKR